MKDAELVRMAYKMILGREPESEDVLQIEFEDWFDLRRHFMRSIEFKDIAKRVLESGPPEPHFEVMQIKDFRQLDAFVEEYKRDFLFRDTIGTAETYFLRRHSLDFNSFEKLFGTPQPINSDPFSDEYRNWEMAFFEFLSGKKYDYTVEGYDEKAIAEVESYISNTFWYMIPHVKHFCDFAEAILLEPKYRVLEMGSGSGNLVMFLAFWGCEVHAIEASPHFANFAKKRLSNVGLRANIQIGSFFDVENMPGLFDTIIFEESFHHCAEPVRLLEILHKKLTPNGSVIFMDEPIRPDFVRPWGVVRFTGDAIMQIRMRGWLEFGFRTDFFEQLLMKTGFKLKQTYRFADNRVSYEAIKQ